ncbi:MAG: hypothetical protein AAF843_10460 [Bacteroidota bacterium]
MDTDNKVIKEFFDKMKRSDSSIEIPDFQSVKKQKKDMRPLIAVAASLVLTAVSSWYLLTGDEEQPAVEIILTEKKEIGSMSLISTDGTIEEWKSPTQSLINDF